MGLKDNKAGLSFSEWRSFLQQFPIRDDVDVVEWGSDASVTVGLCEREQSRQGLKRERRQQKACLHSHPEKQTHRDSHTSTQRGKD